MVQVAPARCDGLSMSQWRCDIDAAATPVSYGYSLSYTTVEAVSAGPCWPNNGLTTRLG